MKTLHKRILSLVAVAFFSFIFICFSMFFSAYSMPVHAEELGLQSAFEKRNVMDDLEGSTRDGIPFSSESYGFKSNGTTSLFSFVEFCYSFHANMQSNYGLYVYIYNQKGLIFDTKSDRNKISLRAGDDTSKNYIKYHLEFLNMSYKQDYEGLFYKFKVILSDEHKQNMLNEVNGSKRTYSVGDIELVKENQDIELLEVGTNFYFRGYAEGFGANSEAESTLKMDYEETDTLSLKPHSTYFRPDGSNGKNDYTQDSLHSVYFAVPNDFIRKYGEMSAVHATWLEAVLKPMLLTGESGVYNSLLPYLGGDMTQYHDELDVHFCTYWHEMKTDVRTTILCDDGFNIWSDEVWRELEGNTVIVRNSSLSGLYLIFNSGGGVDSADSYIVPSSLIMEKMLDSAEKFGGELINGKYSKAIFESVAETPVDRNIKWEEEFPLTSIKTTQNWWGNTSTQNNSDKFNNIYAIYSVDKEQDLKGSAKDISERLYISVSDVDKFKSYCKNSENADSTVYLFRYRVSDYVAKEVYFLKSPTELKWYQNYGDLIYSTNGRLFQEAVDLDFDIIDVTFSNGVKDTVIPVGMKPIDIVHDGTPALKTTSDMPWWYYAVAFVLLVVVVIGLYKLCKGGLSLIFKR